MRTSASDFKRLMSNFLSLSVLQGLNMILPLITLPYLVRVLGVETFGLLSFSLSIVMYFQIIVSFGFDLSATKEISIHREDINKVSEIFMSVMAIKIILACISLFLLLLMVLFIGSMQQHFWLYLVTFGVVIGNVVFPTWFFQGMENMKYITYINVVSKIIFTVLIFIFVQNEKDYIYVPMLNSLGAILGGAYSFWLIFKLFKIKLRFPEWNVIIFQLKDSFHVFLSRVANNGSRFYATTIIGIYFGNTVLGYYSMVEKLFYAFMSVGGIVSQTIYPYMSRTRDLVFFKKVTSIVTITSTLLIIPVMYFNELILELVFDINNEILTNIFLIVFSGSIFGIVSAIIGYPLLGAFGYIKYANNSLIVASLFYMFYITLVLFFTNSIYLISFSIPVYMIAGLLLRLYYISKSNFNNKIGLQ